MLEEPRARVNRAVCTIGAAGWIACLASCTVAPTDVPSVSGPSELALSLGLDARPEVLSQDGASQATIIVTARDASARPVAALAAHAEVLVQGVPSDLGRLSARDLLTGPDGRTTVLYTAPPPLVGVIDQTTVTIAITPLTGDARSHVPRFVDIRLVPQPAAGSTSLRVPN